MSAEQTDSPLATGRQSRAQPAPADDMPVLDHREAKARVLAVLGGGHPLIAGKSALDALTQRNRALMVGGDDAIKEALADQVVILEQVAAAYTFAAVGERKAEDRKALQTIALRAQSVLLQTLGALHQMNKAARNA
ncbi:hypothetical protein [Methyloversatilis universalis]|uniref:hypothetical protein n=1 Tax=Methyloversatilis universalis TaxID=378211 RepID=UPI00035FD15F|nr:hypothetical protein [Methyloversatilis universalis]